MLRFHVWPLLLLLAARAATANDLCAERDGCEDASDTDDLGLLEIHRAAAREYTSEWTISSVLNAMGAAFARLKVKECRVAKSGGLFVPEMTKEENAIGVYPEGFFNVVAINKTHVKRSHMSPATVHCHAKDSIPFRVTGKCARDEDDKTHLSEFIQMDVTSVKENCNAPSADQGTAMIETILKTSGIFDPTTKYSYSKDRLPELVDGGQELLINGVEVASGGDAVTAVAELYGLDKPCAIRWSLGVERLVMAANGFADIHKVK
ncbi:unnamed protein product [Polarella glacialis]|uniref:Aminoacyl-transfer RNA synthetases class-II family profile domain-containing protein n=1 Tax=Polarella glacialis TaxID=89957 RepID=A0A813G1N7_POLGL|nr:unnamed protein product [Polarella glacialis]